MSDDDQPVQIKRNLPITWKSGENKIESNATMIQEASLKDIAVFANQQATTCGSCRHFRPPNKDRPTVSAFVARAVHEALWKKEYLGHTPENLSRCREDASKLVGVNSKSCDHYTAGNGGLR